MEGALTALVLLLWLGGVAAGVYAFVVCWQKGRTTMFWLGIVGLIVPGPGIVPRIGALRLARRESSWAQSCYGIEKLARARTRFGYDERQPRIPQATVERAVAPSAGETGPPARREPPQTPHGIRERRRAPLCVPGGGLPLGLLPAGGNSLTAPDFDSRGQASTGSNVDLGGGGSTLDQPRRRQLSRAERQASSNR
jgi:hypothetical protein